MATFDQLSAQQRAIIELVLQRGQSYEQLAETLGITESRVRELARDALVELAPVSAKQVEEDWRGQLADYILGQQSGPESTATRGHLRRSEAARTWARSLIDSLDTLYDGAIPTVPDGERGGRERRPRRERAARDRGEAPASAAPRAPLAPDDQAAVRRRRLITGGAALVVVLIAVLLWPIGVLTGDDDEGGGGTAGGASQPANAGPAAGIAVIAQGEGGRRQVVVQAANLPPSGQQAAYEVWLYNSPTDARSLGAQVTDAQGRYQGAGPLPRDFERYRFIDVSREPIDRNQEHSGDSVLRGRFPELRERASQSGVLGQVVLRPSAG